MNQNIPSPEPPTVVQTILQSAHARLSGCMILVLAWLAVSLLLGGGVWYLQTISDIADLGLSLMCLYPFLVLFGLAVALGLGLVAGPLVLPKVYRWLDTQPALSAMFPGAVTGGLAGLIWVGVIVSMSGEALVYMILIGPLILLPFAGLFGPVVGGFGGLLAGKVLSRFRAGLGFMWVVGFIGGGLITGLTLTTLTVLAFVMAVPSA